MVFVYGVCVGPSDKFATVSRPSLEKLGLGPLLIRPDQTSIFEAYSSMTDEAIERWPDLEGLVFIHDDVAIRDERFEDRLRDQLARPDVGIVGAIGGRHHSAMSWWETAERFGGVDSPTKQDRWTPGTHEVDTVDGLLLVLSPRIARTLRWNGRGYPGFHGYDSEICAAVRASGHRVIVTDLSVLHDCKPDSSKSWAYRWALYTYLLRWRAASLPRRGIWRTKRIVCRALDAL